SSRRRHTRFSRDWSSDVCSSDLKETSLGWLFLPGLPYFQRQAWRIDKIDLTINYHILRSSIKIIFLTVFISSHVSGQSKHGQKQIGRASCRERCYGAEVAVE